MKTVTCLDCERLFKNNDRNAMLMDMQKHYFADHNEIITSVDEDGKKAWMEEFNKRFNL